MANDASIRIVRTVAIFVACLLCVSAAGSATVADCIKAVFEYGANFDVTTLTPVIETRQWQTDNRHVRNEFIQWKTIRAKDGWATMRECASCSPRAGITELFLSPDRRDLPCGLKSGMTTKTLIQRLGQPHARRGFHLVYLYPPEERNQEITLIVERDRLAGVMWR